VMPTNLYGSGDNYHPENSHVIPALIRRFHEAKQNKADKVVIWGSGKPRREFLCVDDMADASVHVMELDRVTYDAYVGPMQSHINVGTGTDISIKELAELIKDVLGCSSEIEFDASQPDGPPRKLLNVSLMTDLGWTAKEGLEEGLRRTYQDYLKENQE
jgi:GDP-L-fucose synthase